MWVLIGVVWVLSLFMLLAIVAWDERANRRARDRTAEPVEDVHELHDDDRREQMDAGVDHLASDGGSRKPA